MQRDGGDQGDAAEMPPAQIVARVEFAHALRGVAALSVVVYHFDFVFFKLHDGIAQTILGVRPLVFVLPSWAIDVTFMGQFGVGVFFIISGFVVPFSLASSSRLQFVIKRAFRIYPPYIVCVTIVALSVVALDFAVGGAPPFGLKALLAHYLILGRGLFVYRFDGISWTLEIELVFYIVVALTGMRLLASSAERLMIAAFIVALCASLLSTRFVGLQCWSALLLVQGLAYHQWFVGALSRRLFLLVSGWITILLCAVWWAGILNLGLHWLGGYLLAQIVFAVAYRYRGWIRPNRVLDHLGDISYPLYCVHALTGYVVIYALMLRGVPAEVAMALAFLAVYACAVLVHLLVEQPSIGLSKRLAEKVG